MDNNKHDESADANSGNETTPNNDPEIPHGQNELLILIRDGTVLIVSGIFAAIFFATVHIILGLWFSFIGLAAAFHALFHRYASKDRKWLWIGYSVLLYGIFVWFLTWSASIRNEELAGKASESKGSETPEITIEIGDAIDAKDPFGTILNIESKILVSNVWARAYWHNQNDPADIFGLIVTNVADQLPPRTPQNLDFYDVNKTGIPAFGDRTFVNVEVRFTPNGLTFETNQIFQFFVRKGGDGNFHWLQNAASASLESFFKEKHSLPMPFLDVRVTSVEDNFKSDNNHPIKIGYSWQNWGEAAAKNVYIEWGAWDGRTTPLALSNRWPENVFDQFLKQNESNSTYTIYSDKTYPAILNGILSGNLILIGTAHFKDIANRDYEIDMKAIRTNGVFEVRYIYLGGYYETINKQFNIKPLPGMLPAK